MKDLFLIAGPCVIESREHTLFIAKELDKISINYNIPLVFKASFDKANRSSIKSYRGIGLTKGLNILEEVRESIGVRILSDIHEPWQAVIAAPTLDVIQIPAFLCRQTDLLVAAAKTGKIINIKKGQFMSPWEMKNVVDKVKEAGGTEVWLTERGFSFGYNNLVVDFRSIPIMQGFGCPVILDVTHSLQLPGALGQSTGGQPEFISTLAKAGVAVGVDGLFMEVHEEPSRALSDGANALKLSLLPELLDTLVKIKRSLP